MSPDGPPSMYVAANRDRFGLERRHAHDQERRPRSER